MAVAAVWLAVSLKRDLYRLQSTLGIGSVLAVAWDCAIAGDVSRCELGAHGRQPRGRRAGRDAGRYSINRRHWIGFRFRPIASSSIFESIPKSISHLDLDLDLDTRPAVPTRTVLIPR